MKGFPQIFHSKIHKLSTNLQDLFLSSKFKDLMWQTVHLFKYLEVTTWYVYTVQIQKYCRFVIWTQHLSTKVSILLLSGSGTYWIFTLTGHQNLYAFKNLCWITHFSNFHSLENGRLFSQNFLRSSKSIATLSYTFYSHCLTLGCRAKPSNTGWKIKCITCNFMV